ncbi:SWIM zinc finger family protein [Streptomyces sp. NPDC126514]|uniref:SWIM zinc finger family protein n=1 Tax=Streptomyces sp. NPDC126514 TaxID=3155210 RepID=UPI00332D4033
MRRAAAGPGTDPAGDTGAGTPEPAPGTASADPPAARPADVAREALRAARRDRRRTEAEPAATLGPGRARHPRRPAHPTPGDAPAARARALRELLSGAFRLPADVDSPEEQPTETGPAGHAFRAGDTKGPTALGGNPTAPDAHDPSGGSADAHGTDPKGAVPTDARGAGPTDTASHADAPGADRVHADGRDAERVHAHPPGADPMDTASHADAPGADRVHAHPPGADPMDTASHADAPGADRMHADRRDAERVHAHPPGAGPTDTALPALHPTPPAADTPRPGPATPPPGARTAVPRSMAAPSRDGDHRRTFPAFPAGGSSGTAFAETWWGNAWVAALEEGALDPKRLVRGRGYAEQGHVDAITVTPGLVLAYVKGSRPRPYRVQVRLRTLDDADWERFLDVAAERPGHIAALLDKEMPHSLAECGVPLLPGPGDLEPHCSCPDYGHPCKHAAALCYQTARLLDADPFVLLLLRGRGERELLDALSRLSAARAARAAQDQGPAPLPGVRASEALAPRRLPPLPPPLPVPPHPEQPPVYPAAPGGPDPFALDQLATDAAARAHALLGTGRDPLAELTLWQDAVRIAAARPGSGLTAGSRALYASLASAADRTPADLARAVAAWRQGGEAGLAVLEEPWDPPAGRFDRARPLLMAADLPAFRPWRNRLTHPRGHVQLRLGRDGLWYAYESEPGHEDWWPRGTPDLDPVGALTGLGGPDGP